MSDPSAFMRKHTVGVLRTNPPKASAFARQKMAKKFRRVKRSTRQTRRGSIASGWITLGTAKRLVFRSVAGTRINCGFSAGTAIEFKRDGKAMRVRGRELWKLAAHMPAHPSSIEYVHAHSGTYKHFFGKNARLSFHHPTRELRITGPRVKSFIEG